MTFDLDKYREVLHRANISHPFGKTVRSGYWPTLKKTEEQKAEEKEKARLVDNLSRDSEEATLWLGISRKDYEALQIVAAAHPTVKNYGVLVRRLIHAEAKRLKA